MEFYNKDIHQIYQELDSSESGLSSKKAAEKIAKYGENRLKSQKKIGFLRKLLNEFKNIMIIILIISAIISIISAITNHDNENLFEGILIFAIVIINAVVGVIQQQKAEDALAALACQTEPFAKTYRDGALQKIKVSELVPGDVIELKSGDIVPADVRIISCENLRCNESSMTGESVPVQKKSGVIKTNSLPLSDQSNICFSGTNVTSGHGKGIVVSTGAETELGKIADILGSSIKEKTPLEKNIDKIGKVLTFGVLGIVLIVFVTQLLFNKNLTFMDALLTAVALAVAAIPESLPAVITIIMALGVQKLARKNAIVKKLSAVETLGCCNVICSDKTGTLTKNEMTASHLFDGKEVSHIDGVDISNYKQLTKVMALCNNANINEKGINADATETAIVKLLQKHNIDILCEKLNNKRLKENEFNSSRKMMSVLCESFEGKTLYAKGALDYILKKCSSALIDGQVVELNKQILNRINNANEKVCGEGERVIAFAIKNNAENEKEENLTFVGFIGIVDPPRPEAIKSIDMCKKAGLKTIMITGDHPATALSIAKKLGIAKSSKEVLTGYELSKLNEVDLAKIINKYSVFARVTPEHKLMIVGALKKTGNIVAMTGDGMNDAPSIKAANIGTCMGITGTDVTKEVSDIIISDDNFSTIVMAIKEGRTIYKNISKTILFLLSTNIVEVLGIFVTSLVMPGAIFLLPAQILFINLVTDSLPAFALGIEPSEKNIMETPPRDPKKSLLSGTTGSSILYQGFIQSLAVLIMFVVARWKYGNEVASTMSFLTICLMQIIHAINCKTEKSIFKTNIFKNKFFNISFLALFVMILGVYFIPFFANIFCLSTLNATQWLFVALTSISIIPLVEIGKLIIKEK